MNKSINKKGLKNLKRKKVRKSMKLVGYLSDKWSLVKSAVQARLERKAEKRRANSLKRKAIS